MENRVGNSDGTAIPKKARSLDLKSLYKSGTSMESQHKDVKRKISKEDGDDETSNKRKKSSKTVSISRLKNIDNSKRSVDGVYNGVVSSGSVDLKDLKCHNSCSGFNGISFSLDNSGVRIPKRKRGFVGRKKVEVDQVLKPPEHSCSKASIIDQAAKVTGDDSGTRDNSSRDSDPRVESSKDLGELFEPSKFKRKDSDDFKENWNGELHSARHLQEGECAVRSVVNHGESSLKKEKRRSKSNSNRHLKEGGHACYSVLNNGQSLLKKPNGVTNSNSGQCLKEENEDASHSVLNNSNSSLKESRRNNSKRKDSVRHKKSVAKEAEHVSNIKDSARDRSVGKEAEPLVDASAKVSKRKDFSQDKISVAKEADILIDTSGKVCDNMPEDEENLEENAAMMLSSRFDPSCTGFSSNGKSIVSPNGLSFLLSSGQSPGGHDSSLLDAAGRALRPRTHNREKGHSRKRRHYYEIFSGDLDGFWVLKRRIKVFWPLDQCWYYGLVDDYDKGKKLHHVKYDDRDEEWINLENERFKLLLLPSEVPGKVARRRSRKRVNSVDEGKLSLKSSKEKEKRNLNTEEESCMGSYMESEPIISWLARSTHRVKSSPTSAMKKQKISDLYPTFGPPFLANKVGNAHGLDADSKTSKFLSNSKLPDRFTDGGRGEESASENPTCSKDSGLPIVYYRRRFRKTGSSLCSTSSGNNISSSTPASVTLFSSSFGEFWDFEEHDTFCKREVSNGALWSTATGSGRVGLTIPLIDPKQARFKFSFPVLSILNYAFEAENLWLVHEVFLLHYGKLITMWPSVQLEMLFVDNVVGLRYFLFEDCLKQAVGYVFLVLSLFHQPNVLGKCSDRQLPVTSIRFKFSCFQNFGKQFVFAFYNFAEVKNSTWVYMDSKLKRHCLLTRQLHLSECTDDNIKVLQNGGNLLSTAAVCWDDSSTKGLQRISKQGTSLMGVPKESACVKVGWFSSNLDKQRNLPPFVLSFTAAPSFFISLHLKLLMEHSGAGMSLHGQESTECAGSGCLIADESTYENNVPQCTLELNMSKSLDYNMMVMSKDAASHECLPAAKSKLEAVSSSVCGDESWTRSPQICRNSSTNVAGTSASSQEPEQIGNEAIVPLQKLQYHDPKSEQCVLLPRPSSGDCDKTDTAYNSPLNSIRVEIPTFDQFEKHDREYHSVQCTTDLNWNMNGGIVPSLNPTAPRSTGHRNRSSSSFGYLAHGWSVEKADVAHSSFGSAPKKPRTQVSYSLPFGGYYNPKNRVNHQKGLPHMRIRRANEKRLSDVSRGSKKNLELLPCDANVLIVHGDKGWRECGAQIALELFEHNEWKLAVKLSGTTRFSYKAHQFLQPGSTNRYTHAMMWKGGKDWILEFPDRSQWALFKEMHEECYNRNIRAASVKNIPIPGVRSIEEFDDNVTEVAFIRSSSKYFRQVETDVEMALDPSRVLYDMDSDDEQWLLKIRSSSEADDCGLSEISGEIFEKIIDIFEKAAYSQQRDQFTSNEIEELMAGVGSMEAIKVIYEHWRQKRLKKGMPLIRHLQPPLWEIYQQQVKEWELAMSKPNSALPNGCQGKVAPMEKPPMFAFCLKPRGLEVPNKGSKQRAHRKFSVSGQSNTVTGDHDVFHSFGRRLNGFSFGDEKVVYPGHNYEYLDDSPLSQTSPRIFSPRVFSPRDAGISCFSVSSDGIDRIQYQKLQRSKSKKFGMYESSYDPQLVASYNQRLMGKRNGIHRWNMGYSEWPSQRQFYSDGLQRHGPQMLDSSDLDEFKLRDASGAAKHARNMAKLKREKAQRLLYRADLAIHKAVNALMIAEAVKTSFDDVNSDG